jgi:hypothetical protein
MVVIPGLSESLIAVGKRIIHVDSTDTLLSVQAASSVREGPNALRAHTAFRAGMVSIGVISGPNLLEAA